MTMTGEPYNEQEIVALVTEYYHLLFSLCYVSVDEIDFPSLKGREVDEALCRSLQLTPEVISLMRHLPCPGSEGIMLEFDLFVPQSFANSFVDSKLIEFGRDPEIAERTNYLKPTDIALTVMGDEGAYLVLDTARNTLRMCTFDGPCAPEDEDHPDPQYDFDPSTASGHYTRFPVRLPAEFLKSCIDKVRSLEWIPSRDHRGIIFTNNSSHANLKRILIEEYGWPDAFQQEAWQRDYERILKEEDQRLVFERNGIGAIVQIDDVPREQSSRSNDQQDESRCTVS